MQIRAQLPLLVTAALGLIGAGALWNAEFRPRAGERYLREAEEGARGEVAAFFGVPEARVHTTSCVGAFDADDEGTTLFRPYAVATPAGERRVGATFRADRTGVRLLRLEPR